MLPRSGRVGTIYTSAEEVRDRSRPAHGAFYSTISLPTPVYRSLDGKGLKRSNDYVQLVYCTAVWRCGRFWRPSFNRDADGFSLATLQLYTVHHATLYTYSCTPASLLQYPYSTVPLTSLVRLTLAFWCVTPRHFTTRLPCTERQRGGDSWRITYPSA